MREREVVTFARAIGCSSADIEVLDVLHEEISVQRLSGADMALIGGSGHYSACGSDDWLMRTLDGLRAIYESRLPLFASCWGFQALARALGGRVATDRSRAELGTHELALTDEGRRDPVFGLLPESFLGHMGHEDCVVELPPGAVRLASSRRVENQAYTFADRPIYATQFHPELDVEELIARVRQYPEYLELVTGLTLEEFCEAARETPDSAQLIPRFIKSLSGRRD